MAAATSEVKGREGGRAVSLAPCVGAKRKDRVFLVGAPAPPPPTGLRFSSIHGLRTAVSGNTKAAKAGQRELLTTHWRLRGAPTAHCPSKGQNQVGEVEGCNGALGCSVQNFRICADGCIKLYTRTY